MINVYLVISYILLLVMYSVFISVTLYAEFLPCKQRAKCVVLLDVSLDSYIVTYQSHTWGYYLSVA